MIEFSLEQLKEYFGSDVLIGRIKSIDTRKGIGFVSAFHEDKGHIWKYPDGRPVDDILVNFEGRADFKKDDWVVVQGYELTEGALVSEVESRLKSVRIESLTEIGTLKELLEGEQTVSSRRLLAGAIRSIKIVGERVLILQQFLDSERTRIEKQLENKKERLQEWEQELRHKESMLDSEQKGLNDERLQIYSSREGLHREQQEIQEAKRLFEIRLQQYGLNEETYQSGAIQLSTDLIALLLSQEQIRARLKSEKLEEAQKLETALAAREQELSQREEAAKQTFNEVAEKEQELAQREQEAQAQNERLAKWAQEIQDLQDILLPNKAAKKKAVSPATISPFRTEKELLQHFKNFIKESGFYYDQWILENFYTCLKTNYLVILSGISGAGKSKLPEFFTKAIGGEFELIPVRPDWNDDRDLLGFFNGRELKYQSTRFIEFLIRANEDPDRLYIICLDEMNLAPIEYYFAQLLSELESEKPKLNPPDETLTEIEIQRFEEDVLINVLKLEKDRSQVTGIAREATEREIHRLYQTIADLKRYQVVHIPRNIRFIGTVNIDHTTHGFSDKVLDRANVIQFERVDLGAKHVTRSDPEIRTLGYAQFSEWCDERQLSKDKLTKLEGFVTHIRSINSFLEPVGMNIGYRVLRDIKRYMNLVMQGGYFDDPKDAFDFQIKQRILPKIRGMQSRELKDALEELARFLMTEGYSRSYEKIAGHQKNGRTHGGMLQQLESKGYVNYWEVR